MNSAPKQLFLILSSLACLLSAGECPAAPAGWTQIWGDEFDGTSLDTDKWDPIYWTTPHNNEQQAYLPAQVTVADGNLQLTATDSPFAGKQYRSGKVESRWAKQYGRWEIRAKLPGTLGTWPAIWLLPDTGVYDWPSQGEIDIMENGGHQPYLTSSAFHYGPNWQQHQYQWDDQQTTRGGVPDNYHNEFHVYAVEWDAEKLEFFVDDVHYFTVWDDNTGNFLSGQSAPMEVNLNVAVGGDFLGSYQPDNSSVWPQQMLVDYVRVYERDTAPPPEVFSNGGFDESGGSLAGWTTFGNALPNVQAHNEAVLDGEAALKLYGQFNNTQNWSGVQQGISVSGGDTITASASSLIRSADSIAGTNNTLHMALDYYSSFGGEYGSADYLGSTSITIADGSTANDTWFPHELTDTAPTGAVEARLSFVFSQPANEGGAVHVDSIMFENLDLEMDADADADGDVDLTDLMIWQRNVGLSDAASVAKGDFNYDGSVDNADLAVWQEQFGEGGAAISAAVVPEPAGWLIAMASLLGLIDRASLIFPRR